MAWLCRLLGHRWVQYDVYYPTGDSVVLCDECARCKKRSRLVGGGRLLFPARLDGEGS